MTIFQGTNLATGFRKWSIAHPQPGNDDDRPGGATPIALTDPELVDQVIAPPGQPHQPRRVHETGTP